MRTPRRTHEASTASRVAFSIATVMKHLNAKAWLALAALALVMALLLFVPAGTTRYWQAWVYLFVFMGASVLTTIDLMRRDPALLERRMKGGPTAEKQPTQKVIMLGMSIGFIALLVVPALDHRFGWSAVPLRGVVAGDLLVALGFYLIFLVYRENTFTSATIEVAENQKVIATGPYARVRHPMYASAILYLLGTRWLGSYWPLSVVAIIPFLIWRLFDEELPAERLPDTWNTSSARPSSPCAGSVVVVAAQQGRYALLDDA
jgi:protein-S-isoprenylcysteine O-methyltransferase Ste14